VAPSLLLSPPHTLSQSHAPTFLQLSRSTHPSPTPILHHERWQELKEQSESMSIFLCYSSPKLINDWAPFQTIQQDAIRNPSILLGPMPSHWVTLIPLLMTPSQRIKKK
jgi:hypothetical protein